jgi:large conductance mechanosensitive channel
MGFVKEFKEFAVRGNVVDMAVGIVIGAAFGKIVASFVADIVMPPLGMLTGGLDFRDKVFVLEEATTAADGSAIAAVTLNYGTFVTAIVDFVIVAFAIFLVVRAMNNLKKKEAEKPAPPPAPSAEEKLLGEIRDLLRSRG